MEELAFSGHAGSACHRGEALHDLGTDALEGGDVAWVCGAHEGELVAVGDAQLLVQVERGNAGSPERERVVGQRGEAAVEHPKRSKPLDHEHLHFGPADRYVLPRLR